MTLNLSMHEKAEIMPKITVFGIGGAGGNAVNNMIAKELQGVDFVAANTDAQALRMSNASARIQLGLNVTQGLGAGAKPNKGAAAAEETIEEIGDHLMGSHLCFITAGMGGGTGTGAAPIIAQAARELGILTVGVVTKPFQYEGAARMRIADEGVELLQTMVDTLIIIPNQNLFRLANEKTTFSEAFALADDVLYQGVKGVTDLMVRPGLINLDFADVRTVMDEMGKAMMGTGEASGADRAKEATEKAIANPLLDEISLQGARGVLINVTGGQDLTLFELDEAATKIKSIVDKDATIITGSTLDDTMEGVMRVSIVATGIGSESSNEALVSHSHVLDREPSAETVIASAIPESEFQESVQDIGIRSTEVETHAETPQMDLTLAQGSDGQRLENETGVAPVTYLQEPRMPPPIQEFPDMSAERVSEPVEPEIRRPGVPSAETMARLRAAVAKTPEDRQAESEIAAAETQRTSRFRASGLIERMTKSREASSSGIQREPHVTEPSVGQENRHAEQDRVGIPAFLRRQAN